jgi:hypothetical protein
MIRVAEPILADFGRPYNYGRVAIAGQTGNGINALFKER